MGAGQGTFSVPEVVRVITQFSLDHGADIARESLEGSENPGDHPNFPGLCLTVAEKKQLTSWPTNWQPEYTTEFGEIRFAPDEFGNLVEVLDLDGDVDADLTSELNRAIRSLKPR